MSTGGIRSEIRKAEGRRPLRLAASLVLCSAFAVAILLLTTVGCSEKSSSAAAKMQTPVSNVAKDKSAADSATVETTAKEAAAPAVDPKLQREDISFDNIKFDMQKDAKFERTMITPAIEKLADNKVRISR